ncbi:MAG: hypothetical protein ACI4XR_04825 [Bacilli bacterium]
MKNLNSEMKSLLDKLYNLRGEDSALLVSMEKERQEAIKTKERTFKQTAELQEKLSKLESEGQILAKEGENFKNALQMIQKNEFVNVLKELNISFDPNELKKELDEKLPKTLNEFASEKEAAEKELVTAKDEMNKATTKIEELGIRKDEAIKNQEMLNRYFSLALEGNISITRDELTTLLAKFNFNEEEQREAAKLIMFPEDGLYEYEDELKNKHTGKSISDVFKDARENLDSIVVENPVIEPEKTEDFNFDFMKDITPFAQKSDSQKLEVKIEDKEDDKNESKKEITKDELIKVLTSLGYDYLNFTSNDFEKILENYDEEIVKSNTEFIKSLNISLDFFSDNIELLYDKEMKEKIKKLTSVGKLPQDIYLNPNILIKYDLDGLNNAINLLSQSGLEPKNVPLIAY